MKCFSFIILTVVTVAQAWSDSRYGSADNSICPPRRFALKSTEYQQQYHHQHRFAHSYEYHHHHQHHQQRHYQYNLPNTRRHSFSGGSPQQYLPRWYSRTISRESFTIPGTIRLPEKKNCSDKTPRDNSILADIKTLPPILENDVECSSTTEKPVCKLESTTKPCDDSKNSISETNEILKPGECSKKPYTNGPWGSKEGWSRRPGSYPSDKEWYGGPWGSRDGWARPTGLYPSDQNEACDKPYGRPYDKPYWGPYDKPWGSREGYDRPTGTYSSDRQPCPLCGSPFKFSINKEYNISQHFPWRKPGNRVILESEEEPPKTKNCWDRFKDSWSKFTSLFKSKPKTTTLPPCTTTTTTTTTTPTPCQTSTRKTCCKKTWEK